MRYDLLMLYDLLMRYDLLKIESIIMKNNICKNGATY